jgi:hypothetical protein
MRPMRKTRSRPTPIGGSQIAQRSHSLRQLFANAAIAASRVGSYPCAARRMSPSGATPSRCNQSSTACRTYSLRLVIRSTAARSSASTRDQAREYSVSRSRADRCPTARGNLNAPCRAPPSRRLARRVRQEKIHRAAVASWHSPGRKWGPGQATHKRPRRRPGSPPRLTELGRISSRTSGDNLPERPLRQSSLRPHSNAVSRIDCRPQGDFRPDR